MVDEQKVPLWEFSTSNKQCVGAMAPMPSTSLGQVFRDGFAEVRQAMTEAPSQSMITVIFSAYSPDGLIYFRGNSDNGHFVALELRDGQASD